MMIENLLSHMKTLKIENWKVNTNERYQGSHGGLIFGILDKIRIRILRDNLLKIQNKSEIGQTILSACYKR